MSHNKHPLSLRDEEIEESLDELVPTKTTVSGFVEYTIRSRGIILRQFSLGEKVKMTAFFMVETMAHYSALWGRDWIHEGWECRTGSGYLMAFHGFNQSGRGQILRE